MTEVLQYAISAAALGGLYALASLGVALIFGVMSLVNFAHGAFIMVGVYVLIALLGLGAPVAIAGTIVAVIALALLTERVAFKPVRGANPITMLVTSFAVAFFIQSAIVLFVGTEPKSAGFLSALSEPLRLGGISVPWLDVITIALSAALVASLTVFLVRTPLGIQIRAASQDFDMARLLGVPANRVIALAFAISGLLAATISVLYLAKNGTASPTIGLQLVLIAFVATVVGGLGSMAGAALAGFGIGVGAVVLDALLPSAAQGYTEAFVFLLVIVTLLVRPEGFLGGRMRRQRV